MLTVVLLGLLITAAGAQTPQQYATGVNWECSLADTPEVGLLGAASIASSGGNIYILQGNTLRKLDNSLRELAAVQLPDLPQALQIVQASRQDLSCGMNSETVMVTPTTSVPVAAAPVQCAAQDMVQGLHEAHTLRTLSSAQLSADALGVYVLRGGRLTVFDTSLREIRNTPITDTLVASAANCPVCVSLASNGPLMDQIRYRGMLRGVGPGVVTTVGYVQPVTGAYAPNTAWSETIGSNYGPYSGVPWGYSRTTPGTIGTLQAGTAVSPGISRTGYGARTTPGTTGTYHAGTAVSAGITRVYGGGPSGVGIPAYAGTSSWGVAPGGVFWGAPGTYGAAPASPLPAPPPGGGAVLTPGSYTDFSEIRGIQIGDDDAFAQVAGGGVGGMTGGFRGTTGTGLGTTGLNTGFNTGFGTVTNTGFGTTMTPGLGATTGFGKTSGFIPTVPSASAAGLQALTGRVLGTRAVTGVTSGALPPALPGLVTTGSFSTGSFAGPGTATSSGLPSAWGTGFGTSAGVGASTGFGTSSGVGLTGGPANLSPVAPAGTTALLGTILDPGVSVRVLPGTTATVTTTVGNAKTSVGNISVPVGTLVMPGGLAITPNGTVIGLTGPVATNVIGTRRTLINAATNRISVPDSRNVVLTSAGSISTPSGTMPLPAGSVITSNGTVVRTDGTMILPDGTVSTPNVTATGLGAFFGGGFGTVAQPMYPVTAAFQQLRSPSTTILEPSLAAPVTGIYVPPDVTYIPQQQPAPEMPPPGYGEILAPAGYAPIPTGWSGSVTQTGMGFVPGSQAIVVSPSVQIPAAYTQPAEPTQTEITLPPSVTIVNVPATATVVTRPAPTTLVEVPSSIQRMAAQTGGGRMLNACANRVAWMYQTPLQTGKVVPAALRNIINGEVLLGYAGDEEGPKRLHIHVMRDDSLPDLSAKISAFLYPKTQVEAGITLPVKSHGPGQFYANFNPNICDGDMLAVRVKRPGMREQVAYFTLAGPELPQTASMGAPNGVGHGPSQIMETGIVNPAIETSTSALQSQPLATGGHGPRVETQTGLTTDVCPACQQKLSTHSTAPVSRGTGFNGGGFH